MWHLIIDAKMNETTKALCENRIAELITALTKLDVPVSYIFKED